MSPMARETIKEVFVGISLPGDPHHINKYTGEVRSNKTIVLHARLSREALPEPISLYLGSFFLSGYRLQEQRLEVLAVLNKHLGTNFKFLDLNIEFEKPRKVLATPDELTERPSSQVV